LNEKILLVDDAPAVLRVFRAVLEPTYDVVTASNGQAGLQKCREEGPFAVVISDYEMPGMNGSEFLGRVREQWPDTVSMLLTCYTDIDVMTEALHCARIFRFLEKLSPRECFLAAVSDAVVEHRAIEARLRQAEELGRSTEMLAQLTTSLEERLLEQAQALRCLHEFVSRLNDCRSLQQIALITIETVQHLCPERAAAIEFPEGCVLGSEPATDGGLETFVIKDVDGRLGALRLAATDAAGGALSDSQRTMLESVSASAASVGHNQVRRRERDQAQQATIFALARLAEQRDNDTGKHVERVSLFCQLIAEGLREDGHFRDLITDPWIEDLIRSAPLHDLGKVGIPDHILLKPGSLDPEERAVMETHCRIGADTLQRVIDENHATAFLEMSLEIALNHHEKWDGSGYPRGLEGNTIPLAARILALADVYDALTSRRPYKEAWPHDQALAWIEEQAGSQFDPDVVESFVKRAPEAFAIRARLADSEADLHELSLRLASSARAG